MLGQAHASDSALGLGEVDSNTAERSRIREVPLTRDQRATHQCSSSNHKPLLVFLEVPQPGITAVADPSTNEPGHVIVVFYKGFGVFPTKRTAA